MPGLHAVIRAKRQERKKCFDNRVEFEKALSRMKHFQNYVTELLIDNNDITLGFSGYTNYPHLFCIEENRVIAVDGCIYNMTEPEIKKQLLSLRLDKQSIDDRLSKFISNADGEFIVYMYDKQSNKCLVFNDYLGRLPSYYHMNEDSISMSREVKFIVSLDGGVINKQALADYLVFAYPLGTDTLITGINRLPPASYLLYDTTQNVLTTKSLSPCMLDPESTGSLNMDRVVGKLATSFLYALRGRTERFSTYTSVVSLSGGHDCKAVLGGLSKIDANPIAITYSNNESKHELPVAKEISRKLGVEHKVISISSSSDVAYENIRQLVYLKDGLNYAGMSYILDFYAAILRELGGEIVGYTGEGGDKTMAPMGFNPFLKSVNSMDQLCQSIYFNESKFSWKEASLLLGISHAELKKRFEERISAYPEQTFEGKYRHFMIFEKVHKWQFEGEDRNRLFFWFTSPFYVPAFFSEAMKVPEIAKKNREFYKSFLSHINSAIAESSKYSMYDDKSIRILDYVLSHSSVSITHLLTKQLLFKIQALHDKQDVRHIRDMSLRTLEDCHYAQKHFNESATRKIIATEKSGERLFTLLTLLAYMQFAE